MAKPDPLPISSLAVCSALIFFLHYSWEKFQLSLSPINPGGRYAAAESAVHRAALAATGDLLLTWAAYLGTALLLRSLAWGVRPWRARHLLALLFVSVVFGGVNAALSPRIGADYSILPLVQFVILCPLSFLILKTRIRRDAWKQKHRSDRSKDASRRII